MSTLEASLRLNDGVSGPLNQINSNMQRSLGNFNNFDKQVKSSGGAFRQFSNDIKSGFDGINSGAQKSQGMFKSMFGAGIALKGVSMGINTIKSSMDGAISRFDTLNSYPRMLENIGFSSEQASNSTTKLSEGIDGLPTSLDSVVSTTQRMVSINKDLDKSTDAALALNNAFLASGASSDQAARGTEQYLKMMSTGKVGMDSWTTLQETMSLSLGMVAESMGFVGDAAQNELLEALQDGTVAFDDFQDAMIRFGTGSGQGAQLAKINSESIATSITNLKNTAVRGTTEMIKAFDTSLEKFTGKNIAKHLDSMKVAVNATFKFMASKIEPMMNFIMPFAKVIGNTFSSIKGPVVSAFSAIGDSLSKMLGGGKGLALFEKMMNGVGKAIEGVANFAEKHSDTIAKLIMQLPKLFMGMMAFKIGKGVLGGLSNFASRIGIVGKATGNLFKNLSGAGSKLSGGGNVFSKLTKKVSPKKKLGLADFESQIKTLAGVASMYGIAKTVQEFAKGIKAVDDAIPDDLIEGGRLTAKIAGLSAVATGMFFGIQGLGKIASKNPASALAGMGSMLGIAVVLKQMAKAMQQVEESVPVWNEGAFAQKMGNMTLAIGSMSAMIAGIGSAEILTGGVGALVFVAGSASIMMIAQNIKQMARALKEVEESIPDDFSGIESKLDNMKRSLDKFKTFDVKEVFGSLLGAIGSGFDASIAKNLSKMTQSYKEIAQTFEDIGKIEIPNNIEEKMSELKKVSQSLLTQRSFFETLFNADKTSAKQDKKITEQIKKIVESYRDIAKAFEEIGNIEVPSNIDEQMTQLKTTAEKFLSKRDTLDTLFNADKQSAKQDAGVTKQLKKMINDYKEIAQVFEEMGNITIPDGIDEQINKISEVTQSLLSNKSLDDIMSNPAVASAKKDNKIVTQTKEMIQSYEEIAKSFESIGNIPEVGDIESKIDNIAKVTESLLSNKGTWATLTDGSANSAMQDASVTQSIQEMVESYLKIAQTFDELKNISLPQNLPSMIENLQESMKQVQSLFSTEKGEQKFEIKKGDSQNIQAISEVIQEYQQIAEAFKGMTDTALDTSALETTIQTTQDAMTKITGLTFEEVNVEGLTQALEAVNNFKQMIDVLNTVSSEFNGELITQQVTQLQEALNALSGIGGEGGFEGLSSLTTQLNESLTALTTFSDSFGTVVATVTEGTATFTTAFQGIGTAVTGAFTEAMSAVDGFAASVATGMASAVASAQSGASEIAGAFANLRTDLFAVGSFAMQGLAQGITAGGQQAIAAAQTVASQVASITRQTLDVRSPSRVLAAIGRFVPAGLAKGIRDTSYLVADASEFMNEQIGSEKSFDMTNESINSIKDNSQTSVNVTQKQVTPSVTVNVESTGSNDIDIERIVEAVEQSVVGLVDVALI